MCTIINNNNKIKKIMHMYIYIYTRGVSYNEEFSRGKKKTEQKSGRH